VLWLAVYRGNRELASLLLLRGANPDIKDVDGFSLWIEVCISNKNSIKDLLLDFIFAESTERNSKDRVFVGNGGEGSYLYGQGQVQLPTKRVRFAHV
jgi:ankyrin repeat protein